MKELTKEEREIDVRAAIRELRAVGRYDSALAMELQEEVREKDARIAALLAERDRLAAVVERLPKTLDGVPVVPGTRVYRVSSEGLYVDLDWVTGFYSTYEAALAAREKARQQKESSK